MQGGHRQRESPTFGFLVNEMSSHSSHSKIFIFFLSLMSPSLCLFALTSIRQMMRERESPNRASMGGHTRRREFKGKNWTLTQTHTSGLWYPNMSMCNTNIPLWHTAQCVCVRVCAESLDLAEWMPRDGKPYYTWREQWNKRRQQISNVEIL